MTLDLELEHPARGRRALRKAKSAETRSTTAGAEALTAGDLIALLEDLDPATPVVIAGQYGGFDGVRGISRLPLRFNVNSLEGFGPHDRASPGEPPHAHAVAVLVRPEGKLAE
jgi:hypothetical protein